MIFRNLRESKYGFLYKRHYVISFGNAANEREEMENMEKWMLKEIEKQGHMWKSIDCFSPYIIESCRKINETDNARKIFISGCGDCYYVALAVLPMFRRICSAAVYAYPALEFSQYGIDLVDEHSTVICLSMSGKTARSTEAILKAQAKKAVVLGLTNNLEGRLYQCAEHPIFLDLDVEKAWTCGTLITLGSLYALYMIAIELADRLSVEEKAEYHAKLRNAAAQITPVIEQSKPICAKVGKNMVTMQNDTPIYILGGGPNHATAKFGAAKYMEIASTLGIGQEVEEFCYGELWPIKTNPVTIIAPTGRSYRRTLEVAQSLRNFGCDLFMLSNSDEACSLGKYAIKMPDVEEDFSPLLYALPLELQPYFYSYALGLNPDSREHIDPFKLDTSHSVIRNSTLDVGACE